MITKTDFLAYLDAPRHFWALKNGKYTPKLSDFDKHLIQQGYLVEERAREYAQKYLLPNYSTNPKDLVFQNTYTKGLFEARTDILLKNESTGKWDIYEVKSATEPESEHYYDVTFQRIVCEEEIPIENIYILHVNGSYVRQGVFDLEHFFVAESTNERVEELREEVCLMMQSCEEIAVMDNYKLATECWKPKTCPCVDLCHPELPEYSIYDLARISEGKVLALREEGIIDIQEIPEGFDLTTNQQVQVQVAQQEKPCIDKSAIAKELEALEYPLYFLDYETFNPAIPKYDGYTPYQHMVFQYSLHVIETSDTKDVKHYEYLATEAVEPSEGLLKHLRQHIDEKGRVVVWYKPFEASRNSEMAELHPEYATFLESLNERIFDLRDIFMKNYYVDTGFKGSTSIKAVLPVLVPELSYEGLDIQEGASAMIAWHEMVHEGVSEDEKRELSEKLLKYCELDTLSMVSLLRILNGYTEHSGGMKAQFNM